SLSLRSQGMEFASEMVIRAAQEKLRIGEVPTSLRPDGRGRRPHLRTWRDGWRHLRFMLLFSPWWLFAVPGLGTTVLGLVLTMAVALTRIEIFGHSPRPTSRLPGVALPSLGCRSLFSDYSAKPTIVLTGPGRDPFPSSS